MPSTAQIQVQTNISFVNNIAVVNAQYFDNQNIWVFIVDNDLVIDEVNFTQGDGGFVDTFSSIDMNVNDNGLLILTADNPDDFYIDDNGNLIQLS